MLTGVRFTIVNVHLESKEEIKLRASLKRSLLPTSLYVIVWYYGHVLKFMKLILVTYYYLTILVFETGNAGTLKTVDKIT